MTSPAQLPPRNGCDGAFPCARRNHVGASQARPNYFRVFATFFRNSLVREMTFRSNFVITVLTRAFWFAAQLTLFEIIDRNVEQINRWTR